MTLDDPNAQDLHALVQLTRGLLWRARPRLIYFAASAQAMPYFDIARHATSIVKLEPDFRPFPPPPRIMPTRRDRASTLDGLARLRYWLRGVGENVGALTRASDRDLAFARLTWWALGSAAEIWCTSEDQANRLDRLDLRGVTRQPLIAPGGGESPGGQPGRTGGRGPLIVLPSDTQRDSEVWSPRIKQLLAQATWRFEERNQQRQP